MKQNAYFKSVLNACLILSPEPKVGHFEMMRARLRFYIEDDIVPILDENPG